MPTRKPKAPPTVPWMWIHRVIDTHTNEQVFGDYVQYEFAVCTVCDLDEPGRYRIESQQEPA